MSYRGRDDFSVTSSRDGSRSFRSGHDNRWDNRSNRGGSRGRNSRGNRSRGRGFRHLGSTKFQPRHGNEDDDGDIAMSGDSSRGSFRNSQRSRGSRSRGNQSYNNRRGNRGGSINKRSRPEDLWFKVTVPYGAQIPQDELFTHMKDNLDIPFDPVSFTVDNASKRVMFYVKGTAVADSIRSLSRRITKSDGHKLVFHVTNSDVPLEKAISEGDIEKLKFRMSDRYEPSTQLLDLSNLFADEVLKGQNVNLPLNRQSTMMAVTKIIKENIPELIGLDVSNNRMLSLGAMTDLVKAAPNVVSLNIGKNQLRHMDELDRIKGWTGLTELILDGNDLCNHYRDKAAYIR